MAASILCLIVTAIAVLYAFEGAPILAPDIEVCHEPVIFSPTPQQAYNCCAPPYASPPRIFELPVVSQGGLKVRRPAHKLTAEEGERLAKAYEIMRSLPDTDPRSFGQQANIHCAYCSEAYSQFNSTAPLQIHASWLFFPFHRWYLYFHERILASLLNDSSFAIPFWNYDHPDGSSIPPVYVNYSELKNRNREPSHLPPAVVAIDTISLKMADRSREEQLGVNRAAFYWVMVAGALTPLKFFGQPYREGDLQMPGYGTVETMPHAGVHAWAGDYNHDYLDMGDFATAARDPLFYTHHSSIDRLWDVWKTLSTSNVDIQEDDYLDSEFLFYDENAELVSVTVRDSLNSSLLGYTYEDVDNLWVNETLITLSSGPASMSQAPFTCDLASLDNKPCSVEVNAVSLQEVEDKEHAEIVLALEGIDVPCNCSPAALHVFLNLPSANFSTPLNCVEFAGSWSILPGSSCTTPHDLRLDVSRIVRHLNLTSQSTLVATVVPSFAPSSPADCKGIRVSSISLQEAQNSTRIYMDQL